MSESELHYLHGFGNHFATEALSGALPVGQNSPQRCPYGLYAEQFSGTAFTAPRGHNRRSWLYRIRPSAARSGYERLEHGRFGNTAFSDTVADPNRMRWDPMPLPEATADFIDGLYPLACNGSVGDQSGCSVFLYALNADMERRFFHSADGEMLLVPQAGNLLLRTEMGLIALNPGEIAVLPRGLKFQVRRGAGTDAARGYVCENHGRLLELPGLGPIGSNGLANPRDFQTPVAWYEDIQGEHRLVTKYGGGLWQSRLDRSPLDVVAWHGDYAPCKYDLARFNTINSVSFDHPDPSIFTVLTSQSDTPGTANVDFVIFPPRWMVAEHTFRPPWFHRNVMSELMGLIHGQYDAKAEGFLPGGTSLHNCMSPHGPDAASFETAQEKTLEPEYYGNTLAFMFESRYFFRITAAALDAGFRQPDYQQVWAGLASQFDPNEPQNEA